VSIDVSGNYYVAPMFADVTSDGTFAHADRAW